MVISTSNVETEQRNSGGDEARMARSNASKSYRNLEGPRVGCAGIVRRGDQILLGKRNKQPAEGLWILPGGGVDFGETFIETLERELIEEAGIEIAIDGLFDVYELIDPPNEHRVIVYLNAHYRSGNPVASSDLSDVGFFGAEELKRMSASKMISPFVESVLRKAALI